MFIFKKYSGEHKITNAVGRIVLVVCSAGLLVWYFSNEQQLGELAPEELLKTAEITQKDFQTNAFYTGKRYDLGNIDFTLVGLLKSAPAAIATTLFKPFFWEANNPLMLLNGLENLLFLVLFLISSSPMFSQSYGNEWISPNQKYFKITLNNTGIYRIDYFNLISAATEMRLDLSTVNPKKWQIFHNGVEIPIYVAGEQDNIFNSSDFIEFYSTPNDGKLDNDLYSSPDFNANPSRSIISDSSVFYLTFFPANSPQNGLSLRKGILPMLTMRS
jgi:hypothetical protein